MSINVSSIGGGNAAAMQGMRGMKRPDPAQMADNLFSKLDTAGQGFIQKADLQSAFDKLSSTSSSSSASSSTATSSSVDDLFSKLDTNSDGKVTKEEFSDTLKKMAEQLRDQAMSSQMQGGGMGNMPPGGMSGPPPGGMPPGGGGGMTKDQVNSVAEETGSSEAKNLANNFDKADTNSDGKVSFQEAMAYQQKEATADSSSSSASTGSSSSSSDKLDSKILSQIMKLMQAYGSGSDQTSGSSLQSTLSVTA